MKWLGGATVLVIATIGCRAILGIDGERELATEPTEPGRPHDEAGHDGSAADDAPTLDDGRPLDVDARFDGLATETAAADAADVSDANEDTRAPDAAGDAEAATDACVWCDAEKQVPTEVWVLRVDRRNYQAGRVSIDRLALPDLQQNGPSIEIPSAVEDRNPLTLPDWLDHHADLARAADGRSVVFAGYRRAAGQSLTVLSDTTGANPTLRAIGEVDARGLVTTSTGTTAFSRAAIGGATTVDGTRYWAWGATGLSLQTAGTTEPGVRIIDDRVGFAHFARGELWASVCDGERWSAVTFGTDPPLSRRTPTTAITFAKESQPAHYAQGPLLALSVSGTEIDTIYFGTIDRIEHWKKLATGWTFVKRWGFPTAQIIGYVEGANVTLVTVSGALSNTRTELRLLTDSGGTSPPRLRKEIYATGGFEFPGIAFAPIAPPRR
jgi:hypothetical protein